MFGFDARLTNLLWSVRIWLTPQHLWNDRHVIIVMMHMDESAPAGATTPGSDSQPPLSKNAQKRLLKAEKFAAAKAERRARDQEKKRERAEKRRAGESEALENADERRTKRRKVQDTKVGPKRVFQARVVVDLAFDDLMTEKVRSQLHGSCNFDCTIGKWD